MLLFIPSKAFFNYLIILIITVSCSPCLELLAGILIWRVILPLYADFIWMAMQ